MNVGFHLLFAIFCILYLAPIVAMYHLGAVEALVSEYKDQHNHDAFVWVFSLVMGGGILGIFLTIFFLGAIHKPSMSDDEVMLVLLGALTACVVTYFLVHRGIRSLLTYFYPGTTFAGRHLARITRLGDKRTFKMFGTRWLASLV
jgi:hypothetical protein